MLSVDCLSLTTAENKLEKQELIKNEKLKHKVNNIPYENCHTDRMYEIITDGY